MPHAARGGAASMTLRPSSSLPLLPQPGRLVVRNTRAQPLRAWQQEEQQQQQQQQRQQQQKDKVERLQRQRELEAILRNGTGVARRLLADPGIEGAPLAFLKETEAYWRALRQQRHEPHKKGPTVVTTDAAPMAEGAPLEFDVVVAGGTLGLLPALALALRGRRVAVVERRRAEGRTQEWNTSRAEAAALVEAGLLTAAELEDAITSEFNPVRVGFAGGADLWVNDCLNIGVSPRKLLAAARARLEALGGVVYEHTEFKGAAVHPDGVEIAVAPARGAPLQLGDANRPTAVEALAGGGASSSSNGASSSSSSNGASSSSNGASSSSNGASSSSSNGASSSNGHVGHHEQQQQQHGGPASAPPPRTLRARLLVDCMGHYSPIVKQMRGRAKPEGMVLVVGSCADGESPTAAACAMCSRFAPSILPPVALAPPPRSPSLTTNKHTTPTKNNKTQRRPRLPP